MSWARWDNISPDLLDLGTILFSFDVQMDFAMIADEDAKDKLSAINDFGDSAVMGRTPMTVMVEKVKVCEVCQTEPCKIKFFSENYFNCLSEGLPIW